MPACIDWDLCDGCRGNPTPPCMRVCPGDVVAKDHVRDKARLRCDGECWDCYACVKACPRNAIQVELPYALARRTGALRLLEHNRGGVLWEISWADGSVQRVLRAAHVEAFDGAGETPAEVFKGTAI